jgi:predicted lipoprotein with Yx(FWY)xxD motif
MLGMKTVQISWRVVADTAAAFLVMGAAIATTDVGSLYTRSAVAKTPTAGAPPTATPPGITLLIEQRQVPVVPLLLRATVDPRFGDENGMTLYTFEKDAVSGKSVCAEECAKAWPPALVPPGAKAEENWSIVIRDNGAKQWAYRGKPLYRSAKDTQWGEVKGNAAEEGAWRVARPNWGAGLKLPNVIAIQEVAQLPGQVLATAKGLTLYTYTGDPDQDAFRCTEPCDAEFVPFAAPLAARTTGGDFTLINRSDGVRQWAFRGKPLYVFTGDVEPGDQNGAKLDQRYAPATLVRYFVPPEVSIRSDQRFGGIWTTLSGMTLYARETARYPASGATHSRGGTKGLFQEGLAVGVEPCEVGNKKWCEDNFRPLTASPAAQPSGYWTLYNRPDGSKQWAYQGYALYTFAGDDAPGDMNAKYDFDIIVNDSATEAAPSQYQSGLYWRISTP